MMRDNSVLKDMPDPLREAVGLPLGHDGEFYVESVNDGNMGQGNDASVIDSNGTPSGIPGLWCQWVPVGAQITWDENEKFYNYIEWIEYIVKNFIIPWGYVLDGEVEWKGEDSDDLGIIEISDNVVSVKYGKVVYE